MANKRITDLTTKSLPYTGAEYVELDDGVESTKGDIAYLGIGNVSITYNTDGTIATKTKLGKTLTFIYSAGVLSSCTDGTITKTFSYTDGVLTSIAIT